MKKLQCPLCGNEMQLCSDDVCSGYYVQLYYYDCIGCPLATTPAHSVQRAEHQIKDLISKFPPIMRLKPGDLIKIRKLPEAFFVIGTDVEKGVIRAGSTYGYSMSYVPEDVEQWPWELEQKGDRQ